MKFLNPREWNLDYVFPGVCGTIIVVCSVMLYNVVQSGAGKGSGKAIGKVYYKNRSVQRKFSRAAVWGGLEQNTPVYNNDALRTEEQSEAVVVLNDGTRIEVGERSMIVLNVSDDSSGITFVRGALRVRNDAVGAGGKTDTPARQIKITTGNKTVQAQNGDVELTGGKGKEVAVLVKKGKASLTVGGEKKDLEKNQQATVSATNKIEVKPLTLIPLTPSSGERYYLRGSRRNTAFTWRKAETAVRFQVARSRDFRALVAQSRSTTGSASANLGGGVYYWRLTARDKRGKTAFSETRRITIIGVKPPRVYAPLANRRFEYTEQPPLISFSWARHEQAASYRVSISTSADMSNAKTTVSGATSTSRRLKAGTYYWRLSTVGSRPAASIAGPVLRFVVTRRQNSAPPRIIYPRAGTSLNQVIFNKKGVLFNWLQKDRLTRFEITVARDAGFRSPVLKKSVNRNYFFVKGDFQPARYYWRVRAFEKGGRGTKFSTVQTFRVERTAKLTLNSPANGAGLDVFRNAGSGVNLAWKRMGGTGRYRVTVSNTPNFSTILYNRSTTSNSARLTNLATGTYYWRVALVSDGSVISRSEPRSFQLSANLGQPGAPFTPGARIDMTDRNNLTFRWRSAAGASSYRIRLFRGNGPGGAQILDTRVNASIYRITNLRLLDTGRFYYEITARGRAGGRFFESKPTTGIFTIILRKIEKPKIFIPDEIFVKKKK